MVPYDWWQPVADQRHLGDKYGNIQGDRKKVHFVVFRLAMCAGVLDPIVSVAAQYHEGTCKATGLVRWIH